MFSITTYKYYKESFLSRSFKGIHDDLEFLLEEDLGLYAYKVGFLEEYNAELANYGPENFSNRISVKMKEGQETAVEKHNIQVPSFSG